jgi:hypothetical protein
MLNKRLSWCRVVSNPLKDISVRKSRTSLFLNNWKILQVFSKDIPSLSFNQEAHYRVHKNPTVGSNLSQLISSTASHSVSLIPSLILPSKLLQGNPCDILPTDKHIHWVLYWSHGKKYDGWWGWRRSRLPPLRALLYSLPPFLSYANESMCRALVAWEGNHY